MVQEVRARVWTGGISPQDESTELRHLVEDILARERNSTEFTFDAEPLLPVAEHIALHISGFGLLQPLLDDPDVEEIWINEPDRIFVARHGRSELTNVILDEIEVRGLVERMGSRAFVISSNDATAKQDARSAASLAMQDHKALDENVSVSTACTKNPCLTPGGFVTVTVSRQIDLSLPINLGSRSVSVSAQHTAIVDELRSP